SLPGIASELLRGVVDKREAVVIPDLTGGGLAPELQLVVDKHELHSLIAIPIQGKDQILGVFISMSIVPKMLHQDVATAIELADFTVMVIENMRSAITDALTGIYNRRFFDDVLKQETARCQRDATPLSLLMIDADSFKLINDSLGLPAGDKVLGQIARVL